MNAVLAGWIAGYAMSLATTFALVFVLVRMPRGGWIDRTLGREAPVGLLAVPISIGGMLVWTILGLVLALLWVAGGFEQKAAGLGSPSWEFTADIAALAVLPLPVLVAFARRYWLVWLALSALFAGLFGWAMPLLAVR